jgi:hypothetical protein
LNQSYLRDSIIEVSVEIDQKNNNNNNNNNDKKKKNSLYTDGDSFGSNNSYMRSKKKEFKI